MTQTSPLPTRPTPAVPPPGETSESASTARRDRRFCAGHVVLAVVTVFVCWYPYPGRMNNDTMYQIAQVRSGHIEDLHAWPLQVLWHPLYSLGLHPGPLYVGSILLFSLSAYVIVRWVLRANAASIFLSVAMLLPPMLAQLQAFNKDSWLLIFVVAATACIGQALRGASSPRTQTLLVILGVACIWLAAGSRTNALALALPLAVPIGLWLDRRRRKAADAPPSAWRLLVVAGLSVVVLAVGVVGSQRVLYRVAGVQPSRGDAGLYVYDLATISVLEHRVLLPASVFPSQDLGLLEGRHVIGNVDPLVFGEPQLARTAGLDAAQVQELRQDWLDAIRDHPATYVRGRLTLVRRLLGFSGTPADVVGDQAASDAADTVPAFPSAVDAVDHYTHWGTSDDDYGFFETGPFYFKPWPYLLLLAAATVLAWLGRLDRHVRYAATCLLAGAVLYTASYAVLAPASVYRYLFPVVALAIVFAPVAFCGAVSWRRSGSSLSARRASE